MKDKLYGAQLIMDIVKEAIDNGADVDVDTTVTAEIALLRKTPNGTKRFAPTGVVRYDIHIITTNYKQLCDGMH